MKVACLRYVYYCAEYTSLTTLFSNAKNNGVHNFAHLSPPMLVLYGMGHSLMLVKRRSATAFGKRSVGGSAICASVGCVWLLDVAGCNKLSSPLPVISAPVTFRRREMIKGADDFAAAVAGGGTLPGKGYAYVCVA